jgi:hypothetical protein
MHPDSPLFERFLQPADRAAATVELADRGVLALPVLVSLFDGTAVNRHGIPYRKLGMPLLCGLVAASRLGPVAHPLEPFLVAELRAGHTYAAEALGALGVLEEDSIVALADALCGEVLVAFEAAEALRRSSVIDHPAVKAMASSSATAARALGTAARA